MLDLKTKTFHKCQNWDSTREINAYPPSSGAYAFYKKSTFYELFDNAADVFFHLEENVVNPIYKVQYISMQQHNY
jgi:hypothetical protein